MSTDWTAIALAALRTEYPRLPQDLDPALAHLVDAIAERMATASPGVVSQVVGAYSVVYADGGHAVPITAAEAMILRPYRRARYSSVRAQDAIMEALVDLDDLAYCDLLDDNGQRWRRIAV